jgi:2-polyprenyl-6-methoxyphenol hydroxylase-like FAD-dependent oxidoreductase
MPELKTNVLIIGAGPTGLMAACQLRMQGVDCIVIDKKPGLSKESRALVVHARTLEVYQQMGIAKQAVSQGEVVRKAQFLVKDRKVQEVPLGILGEGASAFPYILILEQSRNEAILYEHLRQQGGDVLWQHEMLTVQQNETGVSVEVRHEGNFITIEADYLIAADGCHSHVRHHLDMPFEGSTYENIFFVADTRVDWYWGHSALSLYVGQKTFLAFFPMPGENRFRLVGILPKNFHNEHPASFDELVPYIRESIETKLEFRDTNWFSVYRLHHRCMKHFRAGRVFFAGDAAHVHSPAGGQGMNTGLQDAHNLAWKLSWVLKGCASESLLDTYEQERLPFARELIRSTDQVFGMMTSSKWYHRILRLYVLPYLVPLVFRFQGLRLKMFRTFSQIAVRYISSDLTVNRVSQSLKVKSGERFPFLCNANGDCLYDMMNEGSFQALVFSPNQNEGFLESINSLLPQYRKIVTITDLSGEKKLLQSLNITRDTVILVRPDHYVGLVTDEGLKVVKDYLKRIYKDEEPLHVVSVQA